MINHLGKRILSVVIALCLLLASLCSGLITISASEENVTLNVWGGPDDKAIAFAGGTGEKDDPYLISNGAALYLMATSGAGGTKGKYYKITDDIYLNNVNNSNWKTDNPNPWSSSSFYGHLDGDGHVIYGVHCVDNSATQCGFLSNSYCNDDALPVSIKNLGIEKSYFEGKRAGAFLGKADCGSNVTSAHLTLENCYAGADVEVKGSLRSGGLIAGVDKYDVTINNCYFTGTLSGDATEGKGGLIGYIGGSNDIAKTINVKNSYAVTTNTDPVVSNSSFAQYANYTNVYGTKAGHARAKGITVRTKEEMTGENAKTYMKGLDYSLTWKTVEGSTPVFYTSDERSTKIWNGTTATIYASGDGSKDDPWLITNGAELRKMIESSTTATNKYFKLENDIYLNDVADSNWKDKSPNLWKAGFSQFRANLDGNGHVIYGIYTDGASGWNAFIHNTHCADKTTTVNYPVTITNLGIENSYFTGANAGVFVGKSTGDSTGDYANFTMKNCYAGDDVVVNGTSICGGLIGSVDKQNVTMENCYFTGTLSSTATNKGGLLGSISSQTVAATIDITNSYAVTANNDPVDSKNTNAQYINYTNVYGTVGGNENATGITVLTKEQMTGGAAITNINGFDFDGEDAVWKTVSGGTPKLYKPNEVRGIWDGEENDTNFAGGGTEENPYLISTGAQLYGMLNGTMSNTSRQHYKLTADIYLNNVKDADWKTNSPNKWSSKEGFRGHLDGDGHVIYGAYRVNTSETYTALLFGTLSDGAANPVSIKNLGIENSYFEGQRAAALVGKADAGTNANGSANFTIENCYAGEDVVVEGSIVSSGLMAVIAKTDIAIDNCYFTGTLSGTATSKGGLVGESQLNSTQQPTVTISNSYAVTKDGDSVISTPSWARAPMFNNVYGTTADNNNSSGIIVRTKEEMTGIDAVKNMSDLDFINTWNVVPNNTPSIAKPSETFTNYGRFVNIRIDLLADAEDGDDINADESFDICDLVFAMDSMTTVQN